MGARRRLHLLPLLPGVGTACPGQTRPVVCAGAHGGPHHHVSVVAPKGIAGHAKPLPSALTRPLPLEIRSNT